MRNVVLVAYSDPARLEALTNALDEAGFNCLTARTGSDALATASSYTPQVAVLADDLPEVQGTDVCLRLKQESSTRDTAVLMLTADPSAEVRFVSDEVGADDYLVEPFEPDALVERVRKLMEKG